MNLENINRVYFLGIGGIGMSSLARYFHSQSKEVAGYDLTPSNITSNLRDLGISIHFDEDIAQIPRQFLNKEGTLIIRTPAVPESQKELVYFKKEGFQINKRAEILGLLFNQKRGLAIAGTHGKTSVSSMVAYILKSSSIGCNAFLGGILKDTQSNLILHPSSPWVVAEADEFDRSFLQLFPEIALLTWIDADHLDIYSSEANIQKSFAEFLEQTKAGGTIILKNDIVLKFNAADRNILSYSLRDNSSDFYATDIRHDQTLYTVDIRTPDGIIDDVELRYPGLTNVENAIAACSVCWVAGVDKTEIKAALSEFTGVQRRFDIQFANNKLVYIDDYAHHPRELNALIGSVRELYPGKKITGIFQPHLYSRTRDFADEFAKSLSALDKLILLDIYPARELPIKGISSDIIFRSVALADKQKCSKVDLLTVLESEKFEVLLTIGAGDIDRMVEPIKNMIVKR